jgi:hypothetical protein
LDRRLLIGDGPTSRWFPRVAVLLACAAWVSCGGNSPTGPTAPPASVPPGPVTPSPLPAPPAVPQVFVGAGDIGQCGTGGPEATGKLLDTIGGTVFTAGDDAYFSGTAQEFRDCYDPGWGRFKSRTFPAPGNHEYGSPGAAPYFAYFGANAGPPGLGYYSHELGTAWHALSLNSNIAVDSASAQAAWLRMDLAASQTKCTIAVMHHPLFTSGPNGDNPGMRDFWRILYTAGVDVVVNGHDHLYERFAPQDPDGRPDPTNGIRQFTVGTGGASLYNFVTVRANSEVRISTWGVLKFTLQTDSYEWQFIPVSGAGDSGTGSCH